MSPPPSPPSFPRTPRPPGPPRPLLVTADAHMLDALLRLCAATGIEPEVYVEAGAARAAWTASPLVIVGDDVADDAVRCGLPRRDDLVLLGSDLDDAEVWRRAVAVGADHVVFLPDAETWLIDRLADVADGASATALSVAVIGGRGGAGASTLAGALAVGAARRGRNTALVDADRFGGGIDILLGGETETGLRWPDLTGARGRVDGGALSAALPRLHGLTVLSWDRGSPADVSQDAVRAIVGAIRRRHEVVVVDMPRRPDPAAEEALAQCGTALVVIPAELRAIAATAQIVALFRPTVRDLRAVVRGPWPLGLTSTEIAANVGLPLAGELKPEPGLVDSTDRGKPPGDRPKGPLARFCRAYWDEATPETAAA
ncbi:septum site-determining protein Ssd [Yinghuangia seranimata]|uniref:septum site-determining protein Ssd n=1 Tax=Yinghuangia seranimata TaxID=408067 RepID=UPI00248AF0D8|nr:septum site-determining protein Ssd [Yinghuangia seranimata]MDI2127920.1 CpaE-like family protein [Yinghuangia seranimata]